MEVEVRKILRQAVEAGEEPPPSGCLGRHITSFFAAAELGQPIGGWRGADAAPATRNRRHFDISTIGLIHPFLGSG